MSMITVRKTRLADAIQITTPEDEKRVRQWLKEWSGQDDHDLGELKKAHVYFMRDHGSPIVYVTAAADFLSFFEEVTEEELDEPFKGFTFDV